MPVQECLQAKRERSHGVVSFSSGREAAPPTAPEGGATAEPGQLKSLGTDAFIAFVADESTEKLSC